MAVGDELAESVNALQVQFINKMIKTETIYNAHPMLGVLTHEKDVNGNVRLENLKDFQAVDGSTVLQEELDSSRTTDAVGGYNDSGPKTFTQDDPLRRLQYSWSGLQFNPTIGTKTVRQSKGNKAFVNVLANREQRAISGAMEFLALLLVQARNGDPQTIPNPIVVPGGTNITNPIGAGLIAPFSMEGLISATASDSFGSFLASSLTAANQDIWLSTVDTTTSNTSLTSLRNFVSKISDGMNGPKVAFCHPNLWVQYANQFGSLQGNTDAFVTDEPAWARFKKQMLYVGDLCIVADRHCPITIGAATTTATMYLVNTDFIGFRYMADTKNGVRLGKWKELEESHNLAMPCTLDIALTAMTTRKFHGKLTALSFPNI